jgi:hypothetical protein
MTADAGPGPAGSGPAGPGHGSKGSPAHGRDFGDFVRIALNAAADQIEPCTDGLIPIRARILARAGVPWPQAFAMSRYWLGPK